MSRRGYKMLKNFSGVNRSVSERDGDTFSHTQKNLDSSIEKGKLTSRTGQLAAVDTAAANIDKFVAYRDEDWGKDVLLVYDKNVTVASRQITLYHQTLGAGGTYAKQSSYSYGSNQFADIEFLVHRNTVRIGCGNGASNKALFAGYIDRSVGGTHDALFNDQIAFNDFFLTKQQWVQQASLLSQNTSDLVYDSTRERWYLISSRGVEVRDSDFYLLRVLPDVRSFINANFLAGGVTVSGDSLYAVGIVPGSSDNDVIRYDISNDYEVISSGNLGSGTGEQGYCIDTDGTNVFLGYSNGAGVHSVERFTMALATQTTIYTATGSDHFRTGITSDTTASTGFCFTTDDVSNRLHKFKKDGTTVYASTTHSTGAATLRGLDWASSTIYFIDTNTVRKIDDGFAAESAAGSHSLPLYQSDDVAIKIVSSVPYLLCDNCILRYDDVSTFAIDKVIPGKIRVAGTETSYGNNSWFYAFSVVDVDGQEHHLVENFAMYKDHSDTSPRTFTIYMDGSSENYEELTSPSTDPTVANSIWNDFRRIKKLRIYRAYHVDPRQSHPTTSYRFLREIDINDTQWAEDVNNELYSFTVVDAMDEEDMSTLTFTASSGLPITKPYYTNWKHATEANDFYYYGNMRTDELRTQQILQTPANSPDVAYQHDENTTNFAVDDGDEIQGFGSFWSRYCVLKGRRSAIFNGLNKEIDYGIGTSSPDSILSINNVVYFISSDKAIYALQPSGFNRISKPIDELLSAESDVSTASAAHFVKSDKLWFHVSGSDTYIFNLDERSWDIYDLNTSSLNHLFLAQGVDGELLASSDGDDKVYRQDQGASDAGNDFSIQFQSNELTPGGHILDLEYTRMLLTFSSSDTITVTIFWRNKDGGLSSSAQTFAPPTGLQTVATYISDVWGQMVYFSINQSITAEVKIDAIGVEYVVEERAAIDD